MKEELQRTLDAGMNQHLAKPIDLEELKKILVEYLNIDLSHTEVDTPQKVEKEITQIDFEELFDRLDNDEELAYEILIDFFNNNKDIIEKIEAFDITSQAFDSFMHNLKGVSGNLALKDIFKYSSAIYLSKNIDEKKELLPKLKECLSETLDIIDKTIVSKPKSKSSYIDTKAELVDAVEILYQDIKHGNFISQDRVHGIVDQIQRLINNDVAEELEKYLLKFDYINATIILEKIKKDLI